MRSRWLFIGFVLIAVVVCIRLGLWQMARHIARRSANEVASVSRATGERVYPGGGPLTPEVTVVATGSYDLTHEFVLRGRSLSGAPGVEIATPLRMEGTDTALIVVRGFVPSDDAISVDLNAIKAEGIRTIRGVTFAMPPQGIPIVRNNDTTWDRIPGAQLGELLPYPVYPYALWQEKDSGTSGFPIRVGAPELTEGPHFSYAIQWFAFALIFLVGGVVYTRRKEARGEIIPQ